MSSSYRPREPALRARALASRQFRREAPAPEDPRDDGFDDEFDEVDDGVEDGFDDEFDEEEPDEGSRTGNASGIAELTRRLADRTPPAVRAARVRVGPRAAAGVLLVGVLVAAVLGLLAWRSWPADPVATGDVLPERAAPVVVPSSPAVNAPVVVHVAGRVANPGVVTLPGGSRVGDALTAVGGALPGADLDAVNLARVLVDGEQVLVPAPGQAAAGAAPAGGPGEGAPLNLNTATAEQLDGLPGLGEVLAGRIVAWREENGRFSGVDDLGEVPGIGPKLLDGLRDLVTV